MIRLIKKTASSALVILFTLSLFAFLAAPSMSNAAEPGYTPLVPIDGLTSTDCESKTVTERVRDANCKANISAFIPGLVRIAIQIAGALAVIMIVIGGVQYASSDAISGKSEGKERIQNAIYGLLLAIGAFVILNTINPKTLELDLNIKRPAVSGGVAPAPSTPTTPTTPGTTTMCPANRGGVRVLEPCSCINCTTIGSTGVSPYNALPVTSSGRQLNQAFADKLVTLNTELGSKSTGWRITEAWPPRYYHQSECHVKGTCVDASLANPIANSGSSGINTSNFSLNILIQRINTFFAAAGTAGVRAVLEVKTQTEADLLRARGVTGTIQVISAISAPHWSVYSN